MPDRRARVIQHVHAIPGRLRLRLGWLRETPEDAEPLADALAGLDPSMEVRVRPWTGSVLCSFDPERLSEDRVLRAVRRHTRVAIVVRSGERSPEAEAEYARVRDEEEGVVSSLRLRVGEAFRELNREVLHVTEGRLDLGALTGLGFLGVGAAEIATERTLPAPPWFNLAWWAFRTFTISDRRNEGEPGTPGVRFAETAAEGGSAPAPAADPGGDSPAVG